MKEKTFVLYLNYSRPYEPEKGFLYNLLNDYDDYVVNACNDSVPFVYYHNF